MKNAIICLIAMGFIASCQRGPEDPSVSLSSRKARMSGTWNVTSLTSMEDGVSSTAANGEITYTINDTSKIVLPFNWTMQFDRDGSYLSVLTENWPLDTVLGREAFARVKQHTGVWEFTGGNNTSSKSQLLVMVTENKVTESDRGSNIEIVSIKDPNSGRIYDIIGLSSKKLKIRYETTVNLAFGQRYEMAEIELEKLR